MTLNPFQKAISMRKSRVLRIDKNIKNLPFSHKIHLNIVKTFLCNSPLQSFIKLFCLPFSILFPFCKILRIFTSDYPF